ncbi:MAG: hypothetical protein U1D97_13975 [Desulfuromonadales bacterium]|nr:hypothetical protein [Desulfuromonadales bacterium]
MQFIETHEPDQTAVQAFSNITATIGTEIVQAVTLIANKIVMTDLPFAPRFCGVSKPEQAMPMKKGF